MVAAMTESEPGVRGERASYNHALVDRDSATRRARRLAVQFDVGELSLTLFVAEKPFQRLIFVGITSAMVGVSSSFQRRGMLQTEIVTFLGPLHVQWPVIARHSQSNGKKSR